MSYEPTNWKDGDLVTSAKLNKMEQGIANGTLAVGITKDGGTFTMNKTWRQIYDANFAVCVTRVEEDGTYTVNNIPILAVSFMNNVYSVMINAPSGSPVPGTFTAFSEDSYPVAQTIIAN